MVRKGGGTEGRVSPTPWHATIWSSASWMARSSDVGRWLWTHSADFFGNAQGIVPAPCGWWSGRRQINVARKEEDKVSLWRLERFIQSNKNHKTKSRALCAFLLVQLAQLLSSWDSSSFQPGPHPRVSVPSLSPSPRSPVSLYLVSPR